jgi:hypothetical protein
VVTWTFWRVMALAISAALLGWIALTTAVQQFARP